MLRARVGPPVDYSLCNQTVTIYHQMGAGELFSCSRTIFQGAFMDWGKNRLINKTGSKETNACLLILPNGWGGRLTWCEPKQYDVLDPCSCGNLFTVAPKDKVFLGIGPEVLTRRDWAELLPAQTFGLVVVRDIDIKYFNNSVAHVEAGG